MSKISFLRKLKLFSEYKKAIKKNKADLEQQFGMRVDNAYRIYTVLNIPEDYIGEAYSLVKSDINRISENYIREYGSAVSTYLNSIGLTELFRSYEIRKVAKYSYLIVIGFSLINTTKFYNNIYYKLLPSLLVISLVAYFLLRN